MIMELEEREPGEMRWGGFVPGGGTAHLQQGLLGASDVEGSEPPGGEYVAYGAK